MRETLQRTSVMSGCALLRSRNRQLVMVITMRRGPARRRFLPAPPADTALFRLLMPACGGTTESRRDGFQREPMTASKVYV